MSLFLRLFLVLMFQSRGRKQGAIPPATLLEATGNGPMISTALPEWVQTWATTGSVL